MKVVGSAGLGRCSSVSLGVGVGVLGIVRVCCISVVVVGVSGEGIFVVFY